MPAHGSRPVEFFNTEIIGQSCNSGGPRLFKGKCPEVATPFCFISIAKRHPGEPDVRFVDFKRKWKAGMMHMYVVYKGDKPAKQPVTKPN